MTTDKPTGNENLEMFSEDAEHAELASWSVDGDVVDGEIEEGEVEFFSLPEATQKGSKRFSQSETSKKDKQKTDVEDSIVLDNPEDLQLRAEIEAELSEDLDENQAKFSEKMPAEWSDEPDDSLADINMTDSDMSLDGEFEADLLLVDAHNELDKEIIEKQSSDDSFQEESVEAEAEDDAPKLVLESQTMEDLEVTEEDSEPEISKEPIELSLEAKVEAIIFASPRPLKIGEILEILGEETTSKEVSEAVSSIVSFYKSRVGGFTLEAVRGGYQFQTSVNASQYMQRMFSSRPRPISRAAQETLAIIAYRQPVTRADIEFIRGVDAGSIVKNLLDRGLIKAVGRKEDAGRPILFGTTDEFLQIYSLQSLKDLPPLESFQPSNDLVKAGMDLIEEQDKPVHEGDFVGNHDEQNTEVSETTNEIVATAHAEEDGASLEGASQFDLEQNSDMTAGESELIPPEEAPEDLLD